MRFHCSEDDGLKNQSFTRLALCIATLTLLQYADQHLFIFQLTEFKYSPWANVLSFPSMWLAFPFFTEGLPDWVNIASMMTIVAHELGHAVMMAIHGTPDREPGTSNSFYQTYRKRSYKSLLYPVSVRDCLRHRCQLVRS